MVYFTFGVEDVYVCMMYNSFHRASPMEFIVPYDQYMDTLKNNYSIGMRFRMRFEGEEGADKR